MEPPIQFDDYWLNKTTYSSSLAAVVDKIDNLMDTYINSIHESP